MLNETEIKWQGTVSGVLCSNATCHIIVNTSKGPLPTSPSTKWCDQYPNHTLPLEYFTALDMMHVQ